MNTIHHTKDISAASAIAGGTTATLLFGPVPVDHMDNFALFFKNCSTNSLYITVKTSFDEGRTMEDNFPLGSFTDQNQIGIGSGATVVRSLYGDANPFRYITILGSATASITAAEMCLKITGRSHK